MAAGLQTRLLGRPLPVAAGLQTGPREQRRQAPHRTEKRTAASVRPISVRCSQIPTTAAAASAAAGRSRGHGQTEGRRGVFASRVRAAPITITNRREGAGDQRGVRRTRVLRFPRPTDGWASQPVPAWSRSGLPETPTPPNHAVASVKPAGSKDPAPRTCAPRRAGEQRHTSFGYLPDAREPGIIPCLAMWIVQGGTGGFQPE